MKKSNHHDNKQLVISYLTLRKTIGILGIFLPLTLVIGSILFGDCITIQQSISNYYHTNMRDVFVVTCASFQSS